ncbi:hypothetical protein [Microbacterium sp. AR7-10]|uniref:hypothetical protein n=1 Tax=Microbacterium sp. AR7-10 TaxID=1891970 RepID=UPI0008FC5995|nr:hypothetical protein [Microbacterium sp. AR7-10]OIU88625.1 hypothetical protein BFN01_04070 [Microbacterium sp. AR7-10]
MSVRERIRVACDARYCKAEAFHPARGWSREDDGRDFCRKHTEQRSARFICPPDHKHDQTGTCYAIHRCRCDDCTEATRAREEKRRRRHLYGTFDSGLVDAAPVRAHVETLQAFGLGWKRIAELTGVGNTAISQLIYGRKGSAKDPRKGETLKRVSRAKAEKIFALHPSFDLLPEGAVIPAVGTHRRIQALVCNGWSLNAIAARIGIHASNMTTLMRRDQVTKATHQAVAALFAELWDVQAPASTWHEKSSSTRAVRFAQARRWLPDLAWDDPDTDVEPPAVEGSDDLVDEMAVDLALMGERPRLTPAERRECVRRLHRERWSDGRIAETIGCNPKTVERIRGELELAAFDHTELRAKGAA